MKIEFTQVFVEKILETLDKMKIDNSSFREYVWNPKLKCENLTLYGKIASFLRSVKCFCTMQYNLW